MRSIPEDHVDNLLRAPGVLPAHQRFLMSGTSLGAIMLAMPRPTAKQLSVAMTAAFYMLGLDLLYGDRP